MIKTVHRLIISPGHQHDPVAAGLAGESARMLHERLTDAVITIVHFGDDIFDQSIRARASRQIWDDIQVARTDKTRINFVDEHAVPDVVLHRQIDAVQLAEQVHEGIVAVLHGTSSIHLDHVAVIRCAKSAVGLLNNTNDGSLSP